MSRFDYVKYDEQAAADQALFKQKFEELEHLVNAKIPGRAGSLVHTKMEEAYMWIGKGIRDGQIQRNGQAELQEARTNS